MDNQKTSGSGAGFSTPEGKKPVEVETLYGRFAPKEKTELPPKPAPEPQAMSIATNGGSGGGGFKVLVIILAVVIVLVTVGLVYVYLDFSGKIAGLSPESEENGKISYLEQKMSDLEQAVTDLQNNFLDEDSLGGFADKEEVAKTKEVMMKVDTDGDGLFDYEEVVIYKTNPNKKDTDGDGFNDKDEIDAGYNPLGPGKLEDTGVIGTFDGAFSGDLESNDVTIELAKDTSLLGALTIEHDGKQLPSTVEGIYIYNTGDNGFTAEAEGVVTVEGIDVTYTLDFDGNYDVDDKTLAGTWLIDTDEKVEWLVNLEGQFQLTKEVATVALDDYEGTLSGDIKSEDFVLTLGEGGKADATFTFEYENEELSNTATGTYDYDSTTGEFSADLTSIFKLGQKTEEFDMSITGTLDMNKGKIAGEYATAEDNKLEWLQNLTGKVAVQIAKTMSVTEDEIIGTWGGSLSGDVDSSDLVLTLSDSGKFSGRFTNISGGENVINELSGDYTYNKKNGDLELNADVSSTKGVDSGSYVIVITGRLDKKLGKISGEAVFESVGDVGWVDAGMSQVTLTSSSFAGSESEKDSGELDANENSVDLGGLEILTQ